VVSFFQKNLYNIIIEKQPKSPNTTDDRKRSKSNEAAPKTLAPAVSAIDSLTAEEADSFNFSKNLKTKDVSKRCIGVII